MPFTTAQINHLTHFIGYGNSNAPACFCGVEEGVDGRRIITPADYAANLTTRLGFHQTMDRSDAYELFGMANQLGAYQSTVTKMSRFFLAMITGQNPDRNITAAHQAIRLGRVEGSTLLTELWPLPKAGYNSWPDNYTWLFNEWWLSADEYRNGIRVERIQSLRPVLTNENRRMIVFYGKTFWGDFLQFLGDGCFEEVAGMPNTVRVTWFIPKALKTHRILLVLTRHLSRVTYQQAFELGKAIYEHHDLRDTLDVAQWADAQWLNGLDV